MSFDRAAKLWHAQGRKDSAANAVDKIVTQQLDPRYVEDRCGLFTDLY